MDTSIIQEGKQILQVPTQTKIGSGLNNISKITIKLLFIIVIMLWRSLGVEALSFSTVIINCSTWSIIYV